jgi:phosphate-selective porin OprO/OprP
VCPVVSGTSIRTASDLVARVAVEPLRRRARPARQRTDSRLGGSRGEHRGSPQRQAANVSLADSESIFRFRGDGTSAGTTVADGAQVRISPQAYAAVGSLGLMSEYVASSQGVRRGAILETLRHTAWETTVTFVLTGERASYRGVTPAHSFDPSRHQWGALELAARVTALIDDAFSVLRMPHTLTARTTGVGVNCSPGVKAMVDYSKARWPVKIDSRATSRR